MRRGYLLVLSTLVCTSTAVAQLTVPPYVRVDEAGLHHSQLDNPRVPSSHVLSGAETWWRQESAQTFVFTTWFSGVWGVPVTETAGEFWFDVPTSFTGAAPWNKPGAANKIWTTVPYSPAEYSNPPTYVFIPGDTAPLEHSGVRVGRGVTRMETHLSDLSGDDREGDVIASSRWTLENDVILIPVSVINFVLESEFVDAFENFDFFIPGLGKPDIYEAADLFDDQGAWNISRTESPTFPQLRVDLVEPFGTDISDIFTSRDRSTHRRVAGYVRPDSVFSQCGVQFRMVSYTTVLVPDAIYEGRFHRGDDSFRDLPPNLSPCIDFAMPGLDDGPCLIENGPGDASDKISNLSDLYELATYARRFDMVAVRSLPGRGELDLLTNETFDGQYPGVPVLFSGVGAHGTPESYGIEADERVLVERTRVEANPQNGANVVAHELFHALSGQFGNVDHQTDARLLMNDPSASIDRGGDGTRIPGCSAWRTDGIVPWGCNTALDAEVLAAGVRNQCDDIRGATLISVGRPEFGIEVSDLPFPLGGWSYGRNESAVPTIFDTSKMSHGGASLVVPGGYTDINLRFSSYEWAETGTTLELDVRLPEVLDNPYWPGSIGMAFENPATNTYAYLGQAELSGRPLGEWFTLTFQVPPQVQVVLEGDYPTSLLSILTNTSNAPPAAILIDNLRFGGDVHRRTTRHAPSSIGLQVATNDLMSFEDLEDWDSSSTDLFGTTELRTHGEGSLGVPADGWTRIESALFSTDSLPVATDHMSVDLYVPRPQPNPWWVGDVQLYLTCQDANVFNRFIGQASLTHLFHGEFNRLTFSLPGDMKQMLNSSFDECSVALTLNTSSGAGNFFFDRLGFY